MTGIQDLINLLPKDFIFSKENGTNNNPFQVSLQNSKIDTKVGTRSRKSNKVRQRKRQQSGNRRTDKTFTNKEKRVQT